MAGVKRRCQHHSSPLGRFNIRSACSELPHRVQSNRVGHRLTRLVVPRHIVAHRRRSHPKAPLSQRIGVAEA